MSSGIVIKPARRTLRELCRLALRLRSRSLRFQPTDRILVIAPHSDDETLGCGALLADLVAGGHDVHVAYFTDSGGSHRSHPAIDATALAAQRRTEATAAMRLAGLPPERLHWLGAPDGRLKDLDAGERARWQLALAQLLRQLSPTAVLLPSRADGSSEHEAMFALFAPLAPSLPPGARVLEFLVWAWWNPRFLWPLLAQAGRVWAHPVARRAALKRAMLDCYQSQIRPLPPAKGAPLSAEFLAAFSTSHEFFFETKLPS